jgi:hypothetical protein
MVQPCIAAIDFYNDDMPNELIELPVGVSWRGETHAPAWAIIEGHHLDAWCKHADYCDCDECVYTGDEE